LNVRRTNSVDLNLFYNYYLNKRKGEPTPFHLFNQLFPMYIKGNAKQVFERLDAEFEVTVLMNSKGEEIKFV